MGWTKLLSLSKACFNGDTLVGLEEQYEWSGRFFAFLKAMEDSTTLNTAVLHLAGILGADSARDILSDSNSDQDRDDEIEVVLPKD
jgi:hypothetical protein